jgi:hypothetical protein
MTRGALGVQKAVTQRANIKMVNCRGREDGAARSGIAHTQSINAFLAAASIEGQSSCQLHTAIVLVSP